MSSPKEKQQLMHDSALQLEPKIMPMLATSYFCRQKSFDDIITEFGKFHIKMSYDSKRILFNAYHMLKGQPKNTYTQECNGLILEIGTWRPLVVPPRSLRFNIDTDKANQFLHQSMYTIYEAQDGTLINLYYWQSNWVISTSRGYQMNDVAWDNGQTFQQIVSSILGTLGLTWQQFTSYLSPSCCYTFGFRHKEIHKFQPKNESPSKIWFVQSVELDENSPGYLWVNDSSPIGLIPGQKRIVSPNQIQDLYRAASNALKQYLDKGEICYGFILRSNNFECTELHSDLFIESKLMHYIKKTWYDNNIIVHCSKNKIPKTLFICIKAFLYRDEEFLALFPAYKSLFSWLEEAMYQLIRVCSNQWKNLERPNQDEITHIKIIQPIINSLVSKFHRMQYVKQTSPDVSIQHIMREFLFSEDFTLEILDLIKENVPANLLD